MPCIDNDQSEFLLDRAAAAEGDWQRQRGGVEDFADGLLPSHDTSVPLDRFRLHVARVVACTNTGRWIRRGLARRPAALDVSYDHPGLGRRPAHTFDFPSGAGARLRTLRLSRVTLSFRGVIFQSAPSEDLLV
uniref:Uncharacterized protein n=1 Tax=Oryza brachyantha TaxID=4533 RepID=J3LY52_ORYBR